MIPVITLIGLQWLSCWLAQSSLKQSFHGQAWAVTWWNAFLRGITLRCKCDYRVCFAGCYDQPGSGFIYSLVDPRVKY